MNPMQTILVTGGCGFIGSNFVHRLLETKRYRVINVDKLNYCAALKNVTRHYNFSTHHEEETDLSNYFFYKSDINNADFINDLLTRHQVDIVFHFAAQSHVDQSFGNSLQFVTDNVVGTTTLLECCRLYGKIKLFVHVSTDETTGSIAPDQEEIAMSYGYYNPSNPYAATKACAELMAKSFLISYGLPIIITRSNNVYGPHQFWEKAIPKFINSLCKNQKIPIYGRGSALRKYLYVEDACDAYLTIMEQGQVGKIYEMGSADEYSTYDLACQLITQLKPNQLPEHWIEYVTDRPFHDTRYLVNQKSLSDLGWKPKTPFTQGLSKTIEWYANYAIPNQYWMYDDATTLITKL